MYTILDETSYLGMRNQHWLFNEEVDVEPILEAIIKKGGKVCLWYAWEDEALGNHHLFVAWRLKMLGEKIYVVTADISHGMTRKGTEGEEGRHGMTRKSTEGESKPCEGEKKPSQGPSQGVIEQVGYAARGYWKRFNGYPNRVIIRKNGLNLDGKEVKLTDNEMKELARLKVVEVESGWQEGLLGVYWEEEAEGGGDDG